MPEKHSEDYFRLMIENSSDIITVLNTQGGIEYESPSFNRVFGYQHAEILKKSAFDFIHPEDRSQVEKLFSDTMQKPEGAIQTVRFRFRHKDGSWIDLEATGRVSVNAAGERFGVINSRDIRERLAMEAQLLRASLRDELTGLYNRRAFLEFGAREMSAAARVPGKLTLLYLDLDYLKSINDRDGHEKGDRALQRVAQLLTDTFRGAEIIARLAGDEFAVLFNNVVGEAEEILTKRLRDRLNVLNQNSQTAHPLALSMGAAIFDPKIHATIHDLMRDADEKMYQNKRSNR